MIHNLNDIKKEELALNSSFVLDDDISVINSSMLALRMRQQV